MSLKRPAAGGESCLQDSFLWDLLIVLRFIFLMGSETFMDDVKNLLKLIDIDLSWR